MLVIGLHGGQKVAFAAAAKCRGRALLAPASLQNITYGLYFPASAFSRTFIRSLLPLKPLIFVGVLPVAG